MLLLLLLLLARMRMMTVSERLLQSIVVTFYRITRIMDVIA